MTAVAIAVVAAGPVLVVGLLGTLSGQLLKSDEEKADQIWRPASTMTSSRGAHSMETEYKGYNGMVVLTDRAVVIKRGVKGFLLGGGFLRGDKTIPYSSIVAVQLKKAGMLAGYIQFTLAGGSEAKGGLFQSTTDENSVHFRRGQNDKFAECEKLVEERMGHGGSAPSSLDEMAKLADLKSKGIITEDEFQQKKKQLLGI